ncbi:DNA polymerase beta domain-containing protein [Niallia circulans]|uniref:nucleotidyltransferase family protein n=1 Tax=Shouchella clausii TaxID=79880 RepID=UPI000D840AB9|nr:nucleotidyltransferase domain-containing protein [Shouchella clausii]MCM3548448.1 nucleotidyltransferase domain-containing protein [Shouchella clausii]SPT78301.1 DNA polymerase beta domain-containing protein [Niallia circulans]
MQDKPFGIEKKSLALIKEVLREVEEIDDVLVFGSRAMGQEKRGSDIDLALIGKNLSSKQVTRISSILNQELPIPYFVDALHYNTLENEQLKAHIDKEGKPLFHPVNH